MPDNVYRIEIDLSNFPDKNSPVSNTGEESSQETSSSISAKQAVRAAKKVVAMTGVKRLADAYVNYTVSTVALKTGATEYEQKLQFITSEVSQGVGAIGAIAGGALFGGLAGAAVAAAGVAVNYAMKGVQWSLNADRLKLEQNLENISLRMQQTRSGFAGSRGENQ